MIHLRSYLLLRYPAQCLGYHCFTATASRLRAGDRCRKDISVDAVTSEASARSSGTRLIIFLFAKRAASLLCQLLEEEVVPTCLPAFEYRVLRGERCSYGFVALGPCYLHGISYFASGRERMSGMRPSRNCRFCCSSIS